MHGVNGGSFLASYMLHCAENLCELVAALLDWEREIWGERYCLMISFIMSSGPRQITVAYVTEHRSCIFLGNFPSPLTTPYSARYYPCFMDEKDEAQGQHLSKVFKDVLNDESWFGLKPKSSMTVSLVDGQCASKLPRMCYLNEWMNDCRTEWTKRWAPTHKYVAICVVILPAQQFSSLPP